MSIFTTILDGELSLESIEALRNKRDLGNISFELPVKKMESLRKTLERASLGEEFIKQNNISNLHNYMHQLSIAIASLKALDPATGGDKLQEFNNYTNQIQTQSENIVDLVQMAVAMATNYDAGYASKQKSEIDAIVADLKSLRDVERSQTKAEASSHSASYFKKLGEDFERSSKINLWTLVAILTVLGIGLVALEAFGGHKLKETESLYELFPYFNLIAIGWFSVRFAARNFRSNKHLAVINLTKANILEAGEKFAVSARNDEMKDEITKLIVLNAFSSAETGLINQENDSAIQIQGMGQQLGRLLGGK